MTAPGHVSAGEPQDREPAVRLHRLAGGEPASVDCCTAGPPPSAARRSRVPGDTRPGPATQRRRRPPRPACLGRSLVPPERYGLTLLPRSRCDGGVQEPVRLPLEAARAWASAGHQAAALTVRGPLRTKSSVLCNRSSDLRRRSSRCVTTNLFLVVLCLPFLFIVWKSEGFLFGLIRQQRARMTRRQRALPAAAFPFVLLCLAVGFGIGYAVGGTALAGTEGAPSAGLGFAILGPMLGFTLASKLAKRRPAPSPNSSEQEGTPHGPR